MPSARTVSEASPWAALVSALVELAMHRWDLAIVAAQRAIAASQTPFTLAPACALLALGQLVRGDAAAALALVESALAQLGRGVDKPVTVQFVFKLLQAEALIKSGELNRAHHIAKEVANMSRAAIPVAFGLALRTQGLAELERNHDAKRARAHLEHAHAIYTALDHAAGARDTLELIQQLPPR